MHFFCIRENASENIVLDMTAILSRGVDELKFTTKYKLWPFVYAENLLHTLGRMAANLQTLFSIHFCRIEIIVHIPIEIPKALVVNEPVSQ